MELESKGVINNKGLEQQEGLEVLKVFEQEHCRYTRPVERAWKQ
jgi:hypothetical protein